ncbi:MAG: relaxase/mobilization nuclease domain-containing protein [Ruminiclostridium sp.]|nr:relaxase/mobilization nuclease domain-containing protein [Ruminiclostridium sp.]
MPIVKSIAIHDNVRATLRYILNPEKTEGLFLCNSLNCFTNAEDAYLNMKYIYENYTHHKFNESLPAVGKRRVKAIHYIQSFKPDPNLTPELVHRMGCAFIRKAFGDNVQAVIATHIDKAHYHNHILINTYGIDGHKYNDNYTTRRKIREHSDRTCLAFGVPYIETNHKRGMSYGEWLHRKQGTSWKEKIRREIDTLVLTSKNFDELAATLEERGYTIRYGERPAIKAPEQQRFVCFKTLGDDYTITNIGTRIIWKDDLDNASREDSYNKGQALTICFASIIAELAKRIVDGSKKENKREERLPYLPHNDRDVFQLGAQLSLINCLNIHSIGELEAKMEETQAAFDSAVKQINAIKQDQRKLNDLLIQYENFRTLNDKPNKSLAEKMKLQLAMQSLFRHGIKSQDDARQLELQKQEYDYRITELKEKMQTNTNLISAFKEISDTYNCISKGDYISNLMKSEHELKAERRASAQDRSAPKRESSASNPPVHDITPKPEQHDSVPEKSEPKPDEPAQKPTVQHKSHSRGRG